MFRLLLIICGIAAFTGCKTPSFTTANDMRLINGSIITKDDKQIDGAVTANLQNYNSRSYIMITPKDGKEQKVNIMDIKSMTVRGNTYEPKLIDMGFGSRDQMLFVKRISKGDTKIKLYELFEQHTNNYTSRYGGTTQNTTDDYTYYVTIPNRTMQQTAWNIGGKHFTPNFEDKMSEFVKDCPALADKIRHKEKGYFYAQVSLAEKKIEVLMNIIDEYEKCK